VSGPGFIGPPIWTLDKRQGQIIAVEREYQGSRFFELRFWADGGTKPTKQGVTFPPGEVASLAKALTAYASSIQPLDSGK
jgi:hypothetical protein